MTELITAVDHVPIVVADLGAAVAAYTALLGRAPNWQGRLGPSVRHAWFQLPNLALDLIAADGDGPDAAVVKARLEKRGEGPAAIAWRKMCTVACAWQVISSAGSAQPASRSEITGAPSPSLELAYTSTSAGAASVNE